MTKIPKSLTSVALLLIGAIVGFYTDNYLESQHADVEVSIQPQPENAFIPITIRNIGGMKLENATVKIQSCGACSKPYTYFIPRLGREEPYQIKYDCKPLVDEFRKFDCNRHEVNLTFATADFKLYKNKTSGSLFVPRQQSTVYGCGHCYWEIRLESDRFNKTFNLKTLSPTPLTVSWGNITLNNASREIELYMTLGVTTLSYEDLIRLEES